MFKLRTWVTKSSLTPQVWAVMDTHRALDLSLMPTMFLSEGASLLCSGELCKVPRMYNRHGPWAQRIYSIEGEPSLSIVLGWGGGGGGHRCKA